MFKSIEYLRYDHNTESYVYKLVDTEFECEVMLALLANGAPASPKAKVVETLELPYIPSTEKARLSAMLAMFYVAAGLVVIEYEKRNCHHKEIIFNLIKFNVFLSNDNKYSFEDILEYLNDHINDHFKQLNFNEKYYQDIKNTWSKYKTFM